MSHESPEHPKIRTAGEEHKGGAGRWLIGAAAAALVLVSGYALYTNYGPSESGTQSAFNDSYESTTAEPLRANSLDDDASIADGASTDAMLPSSAVASSSESARTTTPRRSTAAQRTVVASEETIGITPASATVDETGDDIIVRAAPRPIWVRTPSARRLTTLYPRIALDRGREGEARLACIVEDGGSLDCETVSATSGFSGAAQRVAHTFRHAPQLADGSSATGTPVNLRVLFRLEEERNRG